MRTAHCFVIVIITFSQALAAHLCAEKAAHAAQHAKDCPNVEVICT